MHGYIVGLGTDNGLWGEPVLGDVAPAWGLGWTDKTAHGAGDMRGSNNYGARQCGAHDTGAASWRSTS